MRWRKFINTIFFLILFILVTVRRHLPGEIDSVRGRGSLVENGYDGHECWWAGVACPALICLIGLDNIFMGYTIRSKWAGI